MTRLSTKVNNDFKLTPCETYGHLVPLYLSQMQLVLKPKKLDSPGHGYMSAETSVNIYMHIHKCKKKSSMTFLARDSFIKIASVTRIRQWTHPGMYLYT